MADRIARCGNIACSFTIVRDEYINRPVEKKSGQINHREPSLRHVGGLRSIIVRGGGGLLTVPNGKIVARLLPSPARTAAPLLP